MSEEAIEDRLDRIERALIPLIDDLLRRRPAYLKPRVTDMTAAAFVALAGPDGHSRHICCASWIAAGERRACRGVAAFVYRTGVWDASTDHQVYDRWRSVRR
jgi:hypothetical protein